MSMTVGTIETFRWVGSQKAYLDAPDIHSVGHVVVGRYGGNTSAGADRNEDGALVWCSSQGSPGQNWEFAVILDAHGTSQSAALVLDVIDARFDTITGMLAEPAAYAFSSLQGFLLEMFNSMAFLEQARRVYGETSFLICAQKAGYVWWFNVGDCRVYLLHADLATRRHYALNQPSSYEWVGRTNTFALPVPCFASGVRELRPGRNTVVLTTDGLLDFGERPFDNPALLYEWFTNEHELGERVQMALLEAHNARGRDSATLIAWEALSGPDPSMPSNSKTGR